MARPLQELGGLAKRYDVPVVYAGDIFDRWNAGAEVINFALDVLPPGYAVPGQHDLPNHNYGEIKRSAYWTLVEAGHIRNLLPGEPTLISAYVCAHGFPWGTPLHKINKVGDQLDLAVVHAYIFDRKRNAYPGCDPAARASIARTTLEGFDAAAFGDNHKGFIDMAGDVTICNCGGFMRRKTDERDYKPGVGLLLADGKVVRHHFDTSADKFIELTAGEQQVGKMLDMTAFVEELEGLGVDDALEFDAALRRFLKENKTEAAVRDIVLEAATT